jgi:hypothetical protein
MNGHLTETTVAVMLFILDLCDGRTPYRNHFYGYKFFILNCFDDGWTSYRNQCYCYKFFILDLCEDGWKPYRNHCYRYNDTKLSWDDAKVLPISMFPMEFQISICLASIELGAKRRPWPCHKYCREIHVQISPCYKVKYPDGRTRLCSQMIYPYEWEFYTEISIFLN